MTRRAFVTGVPAMKSALAARGRLFPASRTRYSDPSTELTVERLTDPAVSSLLPGPGLGCVSRKRFLLFWGDRTGSPQAFQLDLKSGRARQLTDAGDLDGSTLALLDADEAFVYFDGPALQRTDLKKLKSREVYRLSEGCKRVGFGVAPDGSAAAIAEAQGGISQIRLVSLSGGTSSIVFETGTALRGPAPRPGATQILYHDEAGAIWIVDTDGKNNRKLETGADRPGPAHWAPDGNAVFYLGGGSLWEYRMEDGTARQIARVSQYSRFDVNADASVFVGASASKAAPYVLLLLRATRRELPICEHRAVNPQIVNPVFAPDSQQVFFTSDRDGNPAIYGVSLERLLEPT